ncbi:hypothetical protein [Acidocella sp.]|uniref:hypothetical protein n=1 Tax=Acidocella sp. TaxID=50710 RepID=UPI003D00DAE8
MRKKQMERFIAEANIENFRRRLHETTDDKARALLTELLHAEESKLAALMTPPEDQ